MTKKAVLQRTLFILNLALLASCAFSQEGAVDYRKAALLTEADRDQIRQDIKSESLPGDDGVIVPLELIRKGIPINAVEHATAVIRQDDSITIRLRQGFIKQFWELPLSPFRKFNANGEIAVVVRAFEYDADDATKDFDFGPGGIEKGRLVFYSNDVEENQFLNFDNMPIYGPITYKGNPIGIDIAVIEIDSNSDQMNALLDTLALAGGQAFPPAAPILSILDELGGALLRAGSNDIEMRFTFALDPPDGYQGVFYPQVEVGDYVFIREHDRQANTEWTKLVYDANSGRLYQRDESDKLVPYRDNSYLALQINKGFSSKRIDLGQHTYGTFLERLQAEGADNAESLQPFLADLQTLAFGRVQQRNFIEARSLINQLSQNKKDRDLAAAKRAAFDLHQILEPASTALSSKEEQMRKKDTVASMLNHVNPLRARCKVWVV